MLGFLAVGASRGARLAALAATALMIGALASLLQVYPFGNARHASYLAVVVIPLVAVGVVFLLERRGRWQVVATLGLALMLVFPGVVDWAIGSPRIAPNRQVEQVTPARVIRNQEALFRKIQSRSGILVIDKQTYFALIPQLREARASSHGEGHLDCPLDIRGVRIEHFHWGAATVLVNRAWRLRGGQRNQHDFDHVVGFMQRADAAFPSLALRERRGGWIFLLGGTRQLDNLVALDRSGSASLRFLSGIRRLPGFGIARIDPSRLLRRFDARSDRPLGERRSTQP